mgnify:CR=1 FL=1
MQKIITLFSSHNNKLNLAIMLTIIFFNALNVYFLRTDVIVLLLTYTLIPLAFVFKYPSSRQISKAQLVKKHTKKFVNANGELITNMPSSWYLIRLIICVITFFAVGHFYCSYFILGLLAASLPAIVLLSYLIKLNCPYSVLYIDFSRKEYIDIFNVDPDKVKPKHSFSSSNRDHSNYTPISKDNHIDTKFSPSFSNHAGNIYNNDR